MSGTKGRVGRRDGKRGTSYYFVVDAPAHGGKRRQVWRRGFATKREAQAALGDFLTSIRRGEYVEPSRLTLRAFLEQQWLPALAAKGLRPSTIESYKRNIRVHVAPRIGAVPLQALEPAHLDALYRELLAGGRRDGEPLSPRSVRYVHAIVRSALAYALRKRQVTRNVADAADPPSTKAAKAPAVRVWTAEQTRKFLDHVRSDRLFAAWYLFAVTGMRRGEVAGLKWEDVDLDAGRLAVRRALVPVGRTVQWSLPKTESGVRVLPLAAADVQVLREHRRRQAEERLAWGPAYQDDGLVFAREDGHLVHPDRLTKLFRGYVEAAGLPPLKLHGLRHTSGSLAIAAGVDARTVSGRLGHHSAAFTLAVYAQAVAEAEERAAQTMAGLLSSPPAG